MGAFSTYFGREHVPQNLGDGTCVQKNLMDPVICYRRDMRQNLRAVNGETIYKPIVHMITKRVPDGTHQETTTDSDGNSSTHTVQDYSDIVVPMQFTNGVFNISQYIRYITLHIVVASFVEILHKTYKCKSCNNSCEKAVHLL